MWTRMYNGFLNISSVGFSKMTLGIGPVGGLWVIGLSPFRMVTVGPPPDHPSRLGFLHCLRTDYCQRRSTVIQRIILHSTLVCSSLGPKAYVRIKTNHPTVQTGWPYFPKVNGKGSSPLTSLVLTLSSGDFGKVGPVGRSLERSLSTASSTIAFYSFRSKCPARK